MRGVAIIGLSARFPGAPHVDAFWRNLRDGVVSISFLPEPEVGDAGIPLGLVRRPGYVKAAPILERIDEFDAGFFSYSPREAGLMDPQQRVFLEEAWSALEHAGYARESYRGAVGVYAGGGGLMSSSLA